MNKILETMKRFEEFNSIDLKKYVSYDYKNSTEEDIEDNYIGRDVFQKHIEEWLEFFDEQDQDIFLELLSHFSYFTQKKYKKSLKSIVDAVFKKYRKDEILFVTVSSRKGRASGGDHLRATLETFLIGKFNKNQIIADTDKLDRDILENIKCLVFMDDITGSGKTLFSNVKYIHEKLGLNKRADINLYVSLICANKQKIEKKIKDLKKIGIDIEGVLVENYVQKCFKENVVFDKTKNIENRDRVTIYEKKIEENKIESDNEENCILGFNKGQLLVGFYYNIPNNTLSSFWRPSKVSSPLFIRASYTRSSDTKSQSRVLDMRKRQKHKEENAYLRGKLKNVSKNE